MVELFLTIIDDSWLLLLDSAESPSLSDVKYWPVREVYMLTRSLLGSSNQHMQILHVVDFCVVDIGVRPMKDAVEFG